MAPLAPSKAPLVLCVSDKGDCSVEDQDWSTSIYFWYACMMDHLFTHTLKEFKLVKISSNVPQETRFTSSSIYCAHIDGLFEES